MLERFWGALAQRRTTTFTTSFLHKRETNRKNNNQSKSSTYMYIYIHIYTNARTHTHTQAHRSRHICVCPTSTTPALFALFWNQCNKSRRRKFFSRSERDVLQNRIDKLIQECEQPKKQIEREKNTNSEFHKIRKRRWMRKCKGEGRK